MWLGKRCALPVMFADAPQNGVLFHSLFLRLLILVEALQELIDITGQLMFLEGGRDDNLPQLQGSR